MPDDLTERQRQIKDRFMEERGFWSDVHESVLQIDPEYIERYREFSAYPWKHGQLDPKIREFIYIAIDSSTTHLYNFGTEVHIGNALDRGATVEEVLAVLEITSAVSTQSMFTGARAIMETYDSVDRTDSEIDSISEDIPPQYSEMAETAAFLEAEAPGFLRELSQFTAHCHSEDILDPATRALIEFAISVAVTHMNERFVHAAAKEARERGVSKEELLEVCELVSVLGFHTTIESVPILSDQAKERDIEIGTRE